MKDNIFKRYENIIKDLDNYLKNNSFQEYKDSLEKYRQIEVVIKLFDNDGEKINKNHQELLTQKYQKLLETFKSSLSQSKDKL